MTELAVNLGERSYKVYIYPDFTNLSKVITSYKSNKFLIITDSNVDRFYAEECLDQLGRLNTDLYKYVFPAGEPNKNLGTVSDIYKFCKENRFERRDTIIGLGGGVVGDLAGFVAATYLRGLNFVQVPTTIIAQCDSSIGGKVGVDFEGTKNLIGAFYQPKAVYISIDTLKTLPEREYISGFAEVVKHAVIKDRDFFNYLEENVDRILDRRQDVLLYIVKTNCAIKAKVVELDEKEDYLRAILNFGHTVGHAIESVEGFSLLHGECVSLGMVAASWIACEIGLLDRKERARILELLKSLRLPVSYKGIDVEKVYEQMYLDKKILGGRLNFILPKKIGEVIQCNDIEETMVKEAIRSISE